MGVAAEAWERDRPLTTWPHELSHEARLRVSDVLAALQTEFASLSPSKLRFLDAQGLVSPSRTASGYRLYSFADVERLRYVLRQQRDAYAPLTVIRERLVELDAGRAFQPTASSTRVPAGEIGIDAFAADAGTSVATVQLLLDADVFRAVRTGVLERRDLALARACASYLGAGGDMRQLRALLRAAQQQLQAAADAAAPLARRDDPGARIDAELRWREAAAGVFVAALGSASAPN